MRSERQAIVLTGTTHALGLHLAYAMRREDATAVVVDDGDPDGRSAVARLDAIAASYRSRDDRSRWRADLQIVQGPLRFAADSVVGLLADRRGPIEVWHIVEPTALEGEPDGDAVIGAPVHDAAMAALVRARREGLIVEGAHAVALATRVGARSVRLFSRVRAAPSDGDGDGAGAVFAAIERALVAACWRNRIAHQIVRLGDVLGPFATLKPGLVEAPLYRLLGRLRALADRLPHGEAICVPGEPTALVPVVPIDALTEQLGRLRAPGAADDVVVIADNLPTCTEVLEVACQVLGLPEIRVVRDDAAGLWHGELAAAVSAFLAWTLPATWRPPARAGVAIGVDDLRGYAIEHAKRAAAPRWGARLSFCANDGTRMTGIELAGPARDVVIAFNAVGMPVDFLAPLMTRVGDRFRVVTWENRGLPDLDEPFHEDRCSPEHHIDDALRLVQQIGADTVHVVGWCTGARLALDFAARHPARVRRLVLLNGFYGLPGAPVTTFEQNIRALMRQIGHDPRMIELVWRMYFGPSRPRNVAGAQLGTSDPAIAHLANSPFRSVESLRRFTYLMTAIYDQPPPGDLPGHPTLVVTATEDDVCDHRASLAIAARLPAAELRVVAPGDHYELCNNPQLLDEIADFLAAAN